MIEGNSVAPQESNLTLLAGGGDDYNRVTYSKNPYASGYNQSPSPGYDMYGTNRGPGGHEGPYSDVCIQLGFWICFILFYLFLFYFTYFISLDLFYFICLFNFCGMFVLYLNHFLTRYCIWLRTLFVIFMFVFMC